MLVANPPNILKRAKSLKNQDSVSKYSINVITKFRISLEIMVRVLNISYSVQEKHSLSECLEWSLWLDCWFDKLMVKMATTFRWLHFKYFSGIKNIIQTVKFENLYQNCKWRLTLLPISRQKIDTSFPQLYVFIIQFRIEFVFLDYFVFSNNSKTFYNW